MLTKLCIGVLAAGASRRLGRPKQVLRHRGSTLVRETVSCALAMRQPVAVVVGAHAGLVVPALRGLRIQLIANVDWDEGMASSIRCAVSWAQQCNADALALLVCDQPLLTSAHLGALIDVHRATYGTVASRYAGRLGVPAIFTRAHFAELSRLTGDRGARGILDAMEDVTALDWPDGVADVDVPAELARCHAWSRVTTSPSSIATADDEVDRILDRLLPTA